MKSLNRVSVLLSVILMLAMTGCMSPAVEAAVNDHKSFVCVESQGATMFSVFTGSSIIRSVTIPDQTELSKDDWIAIINKCFMDGDQAALLELLSSIRNMPANE